MLCKVVLLDLHSREPGKAVSLSLHCLVARHYYTDCLAALVMISQ